MVAKKKKILEFPKNFLWGVATSAHQIEGNNTNNWTFWEKKNSKRLAKQAVSEQKIYRTNWKVIEKESSNPKNYISGKACDFYNLYESDFDLAQKVGVNAFRISIEWSRIEPAKGSFSEKELEHYKKVVQDMRSKGIEPFVTLWHWTFPIWLAKEGGVRAKNFEKYFARYARVVSDFLKADVKFWITINEPMIYANSAYREGDFPPNVKSPRAAKKVIKTLIKTHQYAYMILKGINPDNQVGISKNNPYFISKDDNWINKSFERIAKEKWSHYFLDKIDHYQDFIGLNHYNKFEINVKELEKEISKAKSRFWTSFPKGMYYVLKELKEYKKPIYITENGLVDPNDDKRSKYMTSVLKNVHLAIQEGVDVRGYFHWSFMDNFEWEKGYWPKFGLFQVNPKTLKRTAKKSVHTYHNIIKDNGV